MHWTFSAKELSSQRAYISFPLNIGFCVTNNTWEHVCMAKACLLPSDYTALRARKIELQHIKGIAKTVWLFSDGSMQWLEKGKRTCTSITNGSTQKTLAQWDAALAKKEDGTIFGGRLAEYRYYDMDKVIEAALNRLETME